MSCPRKSSSQHRAGESPWPIALLFALVVVAPASLDATTPHPTAPETTALQPSGQGLTLPAVYRANALILRGDSQRRLEHALVELARRSSGRRMIRRLLRSGFVTVLSARKLRHNVAGLWGPIVFHGRIVGAVLHLDTRQIIGLDHDPSGVETLAHELRHQVDASRAFANGRDRTEIHAAARAGDQTQSAQRFGRRLRLQRLDLTLTEARQWIAPVLVHLDHEIWSGPQQVARRSSIY